MYVYIYFFAENAIPTFLLNTHKITEILFKYSTLYTNGEARKSMRITEGKSQ